MKKAQAGVTAESKVIPPTPVVDDFPENESPSSTSTEEDEKDRILPAASSLLHEVLTSTAILEIVAFPSGNFQGAHPHVPTSTAGSGRRKKALPHHSTRV